MIAELIAKPLLAKPWPQTHKGLVLNTSVGILANDKLASISTVWASCVESKHPGGPFSKGAGLVIPDTLDQQEEDLVGLGGLTLLKRSVALCA